MKFHDDGRVDKSAIGLLLLYAMCISTVVGINHDILKEIKEHTEVAKQIIDMAVYGKLQNQSYNRLALFTDTFGNRIAGSKNLENSIDYILSNLAKEGLENVHGEPVKVPRWVRGNESAYLISPRLQKLRLLGLGGSVGTPPSGITAEVIVVRSFEELHQKAAEAKGKIVVYNQPFVSYGKTVKYRDYGAGEASKVGGLAALVRSITPYSIYSPHTGWKDHMDGVKPVPTACITIEDAEMLNRMYDRGTKLRIHLNMEAKNLPMTTSRNIVAEIVGREKPDEVVMFGGHIDSWDVGKGAMDDGGGAFISWQVLSLIKQLKLRPRRTLRMVMWTGEEVGVWGGQQYFNLHHQNISKYNLVMESDIGTFRPIGINFTGNAQAYEIMKNVMQLMSPIGATKISPGYTGEDALFWVKAGVPGLSLNNDNRKYFYYHHSDGDTMTVQNPHEMNLCSALWAVVAYTAADLTEMLPR
ncbi:carboxypeptidase Q-like isoform X1 [Tubulanus polymorphus]|uniref:carboxypeptidase Q-like isoform X1 n=1 Tax=Tubulanus polymorphus TaxID=672921 RepID=UPI003DA377CF